jgi:hypothetical protein
MKDAANNLAAMYLFTIGKDDAVFSRLGRRASVSVIRSIHIRSATAYL